LMIINRSVDFSQKKQKKRIKLQNKMFDLFTNEEPSKVSTKNTRSFPYEISLLMKLSFS
jgi:hypothetical protein